MLHFFPLFQIVLFIYTLQRFSFLKDQIDDRIMFICMATVSMIYGLNNFMFFVLNLITCWRLFKHSTKSSLICFFHSIVKMVTIQIGNTILTAALLLVKMEEGTERQVASILLWISGKNNFIFKMSFEIQVFTQCSFCQRNRALGSRW